MIHLYAFVLSCREACNSILSWVKEKELAGRVELHLYPKSSGNYFNSSSSRLLKVHCSFYSVWPKEINQRKNLEDFLVGLIKSLCPVVL